MFKCSLIIKGAVYATTIYDKKLNERQRGSSCFDTYIYGKPG